MTTDDWVPDACTLPTAARPLRLAEFDDLFSAARGVRRPSPTRLDVVIPNDAAKAARDLAERESACCSFFRFGFTSDAAEVVMAIEVPAAHIDVLDTIEARCPTSAR